MTDGHRLLFVGAIVAAILLRVPSVAPADEVQGADALLQQLTHLQSPTTVNTSSSQDSVTQFARDLAAFTKQSLSLAPDDAARQWLALFDRSLKLQMGNNLPQYFSATRAVFSALPGPAAWPKIQEEIQKRPPDNQSRATAVLRFIFDTLGNDETRQWSDLSALAKLPPSASAAFHAMSNKGGDPLLSLGTSLSEVSHQPDQVRNFWETSLDATSPSSSYSDPEVVDLPDLVTILGAAKAEPILLQALSLSDKRVGEVHGLATQELARKLALAHVDQLHFPPWSLTKSLDGAGLYEALRKKFPQDDDSQGYALYYLIALVTQGRAAEAAQADVDVDVTDLENATVEAANGGWGPQVYNFVRSYLSLHPESDLWTFYVDLAAQTEHADDALQFLQEMNAKAGLSDEAHDRIQTVFYRGLLGVDKVDEGIDQLRTLIKAERAKIGSGPAAAPLDTNFKPGMSLQAMQRAMAKQMRALQADPTGMVVELDLELARLGHLLKRDSLESEGQDDAERLVQGLSQTQGPAAGFSADDMARDKVWQYDMETGRYPQAEKLINEELVASQKKINDAKSSSLHLAGLTRSVPADYEMREQLQKLALVYYQAGRWTDIVTLLEKFPVWGVADLADIASETAYLPRRSVPHLDLIAARALAETGQVDEARPILDEALREDPGDDAAYALLLKIGKGDLIARLDALYRQDQFQERPLIWKAVLLLQQGRVAEAEQACKAAIAVDPSDGEEGKGDRMRAYSVMADICDAKKDPQQAAFLRNVVKAIRLSEDADDFFDAGLLSRAIARYGQALDLFSGAYCIQARIARQLAELGRLEEAAVHYRRAFELMPVSFGRLESHCFGCERAFQGKTATSIAEETFTGMMAKDPQKPQIPYLLGYLYLEEKRYPEALAHFQKAAQLDPDYINAWRHIAEISEDFHLEPTLRDTAIFNLIRLDPAGRHVTPPVAGVRQLDKLWESEETASKSILPAPTALLKLTASAAALQAAGDGGGGGISSLLTRFSGGSAEMQSWMDLQQLGFSLSQGTYQRSGEGLSPRSAILRNKVIAGALDFL